MSDIIKENEAEIIDADVEEITVVSEREVIIAPERGLQTSSPQTNDYFVCIVLPFLFLTVALFGGMRFGIENNEFLFHAPPLIALVFGVLLIILLVRSGLIEPAGWFSESFPLLENASAGVLFISLYAASVQVFNSLLPEAGLSFWIVGFCFLWTLWNNLFAGFDPKRLLQSLGGLFVFAFAFKYMILLNLSVKQSDSWWSLITSGNLTTEALTYLFSVPGYSGGTGYLQFFTLMIYLLGLYFLKPRLR